MLILRHFRTLVVIASVVLLFQLKITEAASVEAQLIERTRPQDRRVTWPGSSVQIAKNRQGQLIAVLRGRLNQKDWHLIWGSKHIPVKNQQFRLLIPIVAELTNVTFVAVGPRGETAPQNLQLHLAKFLALTRKKKPKTKKAGPSITPGIGVSHLSYRQTDTEDLSGITPTAKASFRMPIGQSRWDLGFSGYMSLLPLKATTGQTLRFLGLNFRVGHNVILKNGWSIGIHTGWYYTTTLVSEQIFGFANMQGPQLFPTFRKQFHGGNSLSGYLKLSPVSDGVSLPLSLRNREIAGGLAYGFTLSSGFPLAITLDVASLGLDYQQVQVSSQSVTLGISANLGL